MARMLTRSRADETEFEAIELGRPDGQTLFGQAVRAHKRILIPLYPMSEIDKLETQVCPEGYALEFLPVPIGGPHGKVYLLQPPETESLGCKASPGTDVPLLPNKAVGKVLVSRLGQQTPRRLGVKNPAEETCCYPNQKCLLPINESAGEVVTRLNRAFDSASVWWGSAYPSSASPYRLSARS